MIRGTSQINLDAKGRLAIPTKHRDDLMKDCGGHMVMTISTNDRCLWLYKLPTWEEVERKVIALPTLNSHTRRVRQMLIGHADDCEMDASGRILVPATLREFAQLSKKIVLVGQGDKYEVWDAEHWKAHQDSFLNGSSDESDIPPELAALSF
ncbi:MAG: division/cell wall cluster transcriptional repressor MraZ [Pseudomonadota bacterium]